MLVAVLSLEKAQELHDAWMIDPTHDLHLFKDVRALRLAQLLCVQETRQRCRARSEREK